MTLLSVERGVSWLKPDGTLNAEWLAGDAPGAPTGKRTDIYVKDMPMTTEATVAQLAGNRALNLRCAFAQAAHCTVAYDMCPKWRRKRKAALLDEALHRWHVARIVRDSLAMSDGVFV